MELKEKEKELEQKLQDNLFSETLQINSKLFLTMKFKLLWCCIKVLDYF